MLLTDVFCYAILMITVAESWAYSGEREKHIAKKQNPMMTRRESTILIDSAPMDKIFQRPKVIRRISKKRQTPVRTTYGPPRSKYGPPRSVKKPGKSMYRGKAQAKHPNQKHRGQKTRYGAPKRKTPKPHYGPPKSNQQRPNYYTEGQGFAEPPSTYNQHNTKATYNNDYKTTYDNSYTQPDHEYESKPYENQFSSPASFNDFSTKHQDFSKPYNDFQSNKQNYAEPPVDSYGTPIKESLHDLTYNPTNIYSETEQKFSYNNQPWQSFNDLKIDGSNSYLDARKPIEHEMYVVEPEPLDDEQNLNSYSDIYNSRQVKQKKKKKANAYDSVKLLNQPWKGKVKEESKEEVIVGGQYAEPPARYVPKFQPSAVMMNDENEFTPLSFSYSSEGQPAAISSYVNYKNSNMAFSPQNLNDAFSIVDKK